MLKNILKQPNLWGGIIPLHLIGVYSIYNIFAGGAPSWWLMATVIGYFCMCILGADMGYHRLFSHRGYKVHPIIERLLLFFGVMSMQGSPIFWIGVHRGYHHRYSDTDKDVHSPRHGFWHSYILWTFKLSKMNIRSVIDLTKDPYMVFAHRHYSKIIWVTHLVVAMISIDLWLYLLVLPALITLHGFLAQTSITHIRWLGYQRHKTGDDSMNCPWLFPIILGAAWHNNHHSKGRNPNFSERWWELDPAYWIIQLIRIK